MTNPIKAIDDIIQYIMHDNAYLTRDDQSSVEWRLNEVKEYIKELYASKSKHFS